MGGKIRTTEDLGRDLCATCRRLLKYLHKHHYSKIKKGEFHSKEATIKFFFYRGKLFAYLTDLKDLTIIENNKYWAKVYDKVSWKFDRYEKAIKPFLEKYILNNNT